MSKEACAKIKLVNQYIFISHLDTVIIIFKSQLQGHTALAHQIEILCEQTTQIGGANAYLPKLGKADELVALLQKHIIRFGIHQNHHKQQVNQQQVDQ